MHRTWEEAGRTGSPEIHVLTAGRPDPDLLATWEHHGVPDVIWGLPDRPADQVVAFLGRQAARLGR